jgi:hypothetical protein
MYMVNLKTKWIDLLLFIYKQDRITFKEQKIYRSVEFYKVVNKLKDIGWVKVKKIELNGSFYRNEYRLTVEGNLVAELVFSHLNS